MLEQAFKILRRISAMLCPPVHYDQESETTPITTGRAREFQLHNFAPSECLTSREQCILVTEVLSTVGLAEAHNARGVQPPCVAGAPRSDAEAKRDIVHAVDDNALVLGAVL